MTQSLFVKSFILVLALTCCNAAVTRRPSIRPANNQSPPIEFPYAYCHAAKPTSSSYVPLKDAELVKVQLMVRHGDRTPLVFLDNFPERWECDEGSSKSQSNGGKNTVSALTENFVRVPKNYPFKNVLWEGSCDSGQLTIKGSKQHHELGSALRQIYVDKLKFLPAQVSRQEAEELFYIRSTDYRRTQDSARFLLSGLYPTSAASAQTPLLRLETFPWSMDTLNPSSIKDNGKCPRLNQILEGLSTHPDMAKFYRSTEALRQRIRSTVKPTVQSFKREPSMVDLFELVNTRTCNNIKLPCFSGSCLTAKDIEDVQKATFEEYDLRLSGLDVSSTLTQLEMGLFLQELKDSLVKSRPIFELYSGHDTSIQGILALLESTDLRWPPYTSNLLIELWRVRSSNKKMVRIIYNGNPLKTKWTDFTNGCDLDVFLNFVAGKLPKDFAAACERKK